MTIDYKVQTTVLLINNVLLVYNSLRLVTSYKNKIVLPAIKFLVIKWFIKYIVLVSFNNLFLHLEFVCFYIHRSNLIFHYLKDF